MVTLMGTTLLESTVACPVALKVQNDFSPNKEQQNSHEMMFMRKLQANFILMLLGDCPRNIIHCDFTKETHNNGHMRITK